MEVHLLSEKVLRVIWVSALMLFLNTTGTFLLDVTPSQLTRLNARVTPQRLPAKHHEKGKMSLPENKNPCSSNPVGDSKEQLPCETSPVALDFINSKTDSNRSWEDYGFLSCSTTIRVLPAKVHGCPDGFQCQIYESGDPVTGKPNKGMCVSDYVPSDGYSNEEDLGQHGMSLREISNVYLPGGCLLTSTEYDDLESFLKGGHYSSCKCDQGLVLCKIPFKKNFLS